MHAAATVAQGCFSATSEYILETLLFTVLYILSVSFFFIKDVYIEIWGKKRILMMAEKTVIHLGQL